MRTVDHPKDLFREIDATEIEGETYKLHVDRSPPKAAREVGENMPKGNVTEITVEFEDLCTEKREREAALSAIQDEAIAVDGKSDLSPAFETKFVDEDGVEYFCDESRMGYEVVSQKEPKEGAYACIFPDRIVRITE